MVSIVSLLLSLCLLLVHFETVISQKKYVRGCYYTNWSQYRPDRGKFLPEDYVPGLCTHILFAFVGMNDDFSLTNVEWNDIPVQGAGGGLYGRINALKSTDPGLKTLYSIGGWNFGTAKFKSMASSDANRKKFVANAIAYARQWGFDGVDLDWEYPDASDKANHAALIKTLRSVAEAEAQSTGNSRLLVTIAVSPAQAAISTGYDGASLGNDLDYLFLMSYDYWGPWSTNIGFNSPLFPRQGMSLSDQLLNTNFSAGYWSQVGLPKEKIIIGIATYGRGWQLDQPTAAIPQNMGASVPFPAKPYTQEAGYAAYYEICEVVASGGIRHWQDEQKVPFVIKDGTEWWGYDDTQSITEKMQWLMAQGYGGAFVWTLDFDDFNGKCSNGNGQKYPLLTAMAKTLGGSRPPAALSTPAPTLPIKPVTLPLITPSPGTAFTCTSDGFFPNPTSCFKFIRCVSGIRYDFDCPPSMSFHPDTNSCGTGMANCASNDREISLRPTVHGAVDSSSNKHHHSSPKPSTLRLALLP